MKRPRSTSSRAEDTRSTSAEVETASGMSGVVRMPQRKVITIAPRGKRYIFARSLGLWQSEKDGRPVLVIERHWSKTSGIWINTRWGCVWVRFRRFGAR